MDSPILHSVSFAVDNVDTMNAAHLDDEAWIVCISSRLDLKVHLKVH